GPGLGLLTLVVAAVLLLDGVLGIVEGLGSFGADRWTAILTGAALVVVGLLALLWRDVALLVVAVAFGVRLVVLGVRLVSGPRTARRTRAARPAGRWHLARAVAAVAGALA